MTIRKAEKKDIPALKKLLAQVLQVHVDGRPDLFKAGNIKYTDAQLEALLVDNTVNIFVADTDAGVEGYAFCFIEEHESEHLKKIKTLYIDDLCVDEGSRGKHIGRALLDFVTDFAKKEECYSITLNVWACNEGARRFYEKCGLSEQKIGMEKIL